MSFIIYAPGLQLLTHDFSKPSETFETFHAIASELDLPMVELNYQNNESMPNPVKAGEILIEDNGINFFDTSDYGNGINGFQADFQTGGIWFGNSVGAHMMLEAVGNTFFQPDHIILYRPILGVQSKIVELAMKQGPEAVALLDDVINGKGQFPVPVSGGGTVPIGRDFFVPDATHGGEVSSVWVQAFSDERLEKMKAAGFSQQTVHLFGFSQLYIKKLRENMEGIGVTILMAEEDDLCHKDDVAAFKRDVAPHAEVVPMPGGHGWYEDRKDYFRAAIAPFAPSRPAATAKPAAPGKPHWVNEL